MTPDGQVLCTCGEWLYVFRLEEGWGVQHGTDPENSILVDDIRFIYMGEPWGKVEEWRKRVHEYESR